MMTMKKYFLRIIILAMMVLSISILASCGDDVEIIEISGFPRVLFSIDELTYSATDVLRVEILDERVEMLNIAGGESRYTNPSLRVCTVHRFRILEVYRSSTGAEIGDIREVQQLGGRYEDEYWVNRNMQRFRSGDDLILFLVQREGENRPAILVGSNAVYWFPPPINRMTTTLSDNQVIQSFVGDTNLTLTAGDLKHIAETPITIALSQHEWIIGASQAIVTIQATSNHRLNVSSSAEWLTVERWGDTLHLAAEANPNFTERTAVVTVSAGEIVETLTVTQAAKVPTLALARNAWNTGWLTTSVEVTVTTNQPSWNVVSDQSWLSVVRLNNGFRLIADTNHGEDRTATVTVTAGVLREMVTVRQDGAINHGLICSVCFQFELDEEGYCPNGCIIHIR